MINVIGDNLPVAIGIALSPLPIVAVILMLFTQKARTNSIAFAVGWILGLAVVGAIVLAVVDAESAAVTESTESMISGIVKLVLALLLFVFAGIQWRKRPKGDEEPETPKWMAAVDRFTVGKSLAVAFVLSGVNPKNLVLNIAAAVTIAGAGLTVGGQALSMAIFILIASLSILAPVFYYLVAPGRAEKTLNTWKTWLIAHNSAVMSVLFAVFGFKLLGDGLSALLG